MNRPRPNILVITSDQQRADTLGIMGCRWIRTPHLDALARSGQILEQAFATSPVCTPSRVSLFTGMLPREHGCWNIGVNAAGDVPFLSHRLSAMGYRTHHVGKAHWKAQGCPSHRSEESLETAPVSEDPMAYMGFQSAMLSIGHPGYLHRAGAYGAYLRRVSGSPATLEKWLRMEAFGQRDFGGQAMEWDLPTGHHSSPWTARCAVDFLEGHRPGDGPFFLNVGFPDPHHPHALPRDFQDRIDPASVPLPEVHPGELDDKPGHFRAAREGRLDHGPWRGEHPVAGQGKGFDYRDIPEAEVRQARAHYGGMVQLMDREIGHILEALDRTGHRENTLVVFTSDHGELLGDHGLWLKGPFAYDAVHQVPCIVSWPGAIPPGGRTRSLVSLADMAPTIMAAAGAPPAAEDDGYGRDLLPWFRGEGPPPRTSVITESTDDPRGISSVTVRTARYRLTVYEPTAYGRGSEIAGRAIKGTKGDPPAAGTGPVASGQWSDVIGELIDRVSDGKERLNLFHANRKETEEIKADLIEVIHRETRRPARRLPRISYS